MATDRQGTMTAGASPSPETASQLAVGTEAVEGWQRRKIHTGDVEPTYHLCRSGVTSQRPQAVILLAIIPNSRQLLNLNPRHLILPFSVQE